MTGHLPPSILSALADGELSDEQLASANEHLAGCPSCTSIALGQSLLKSATVRAGHRYTPPAQLRERLARLASQEDAKPDAAQISPPSLRNPSWRFGMLGWATAAALLVIAVSIGLVQRSAVRSRIASAQRASLVTEVFDQHIATLAANLPPQVLSSDRHTVKPWFQGKIPFSFNLPENLPADTKLDGANLTYLHNQPVAQLLYSIGRHRVSVFVRQKSGATTAIEPVAEQSGFHVMAFSAKGLEGVAISDVDPARLSDLVRMLEESQTKP